MLEGLDTFFNVITGPLFRLPEPFPILVISLFLTLVTTLIYKYVTDQNLMKTLKDEMKALQAEMKTLKEHPEKMMAVQKQAMQKNMKYMMQSFKPMLITFIPVVFIFGWLNRHYAALGNPDVFFGISWLWTYIIFSLVFSIGLRKFLKVY